MSDDVDVIFKGGIPATGNAKIRRSSEAKKRLASCKLIQCGSKFRLHNEEFATSVSAADALWVIDALAFGAKNDRVLRRVVVWSND